MQRRDVFSIFRRLVQLLAFLFFPGLFADTFRAFLNITKLLARGLFTWQDAGISLCILAATIPATFFLGRLFCSFFCSFGAMQDAAFRLGQKVCKKGKITLTQWDQWGRFLKYGILLACMGTTIGGFFNLSTISPWSVFGQLSSLAGWKQLGSLSVAGSVLLLAVFFASMAVSRFFCRYLCPMGAIYGILSLLHPRKIRRTQNCGGSCRLCECKCEMGVPLKKGELVRSPECIACMGCVRICPRKNLTTGKHPLRYVGLSVAVLVGMILISRAGIQRMVRTGEFPVEMTGAGRYTDGIYEGSARGFRGETNVRVTVQNGYLQSVELLSSDDDEAYLQIGRRVIGRILSAQSSNVEAVSGATMSSFGILGAVRNALPESAWSDLQEPATGNFSNGIYQGAGEGFRGEVVVEVTVAEGALRNVRVISYYDDDDYFDQAMEFVIADILRKQKVDVDALSGATYSSEGIIKAAADALDIPEEDLTLKGGDGLKAKHKNRGHKVQKFK